MGNDTPNRHVTVDELRHRFQFHPADSANSQESQQLVRDVLLEAADKIVVATGAPSREQSTALTKLEEALFWANAAITRADGPAV